MSEERNQYAVVPFDTFERYLGPRYENIPGVEYILENGTLLYFIMALTLCLEGQEICCVSLMCRWTTKTSC